VCQIMMKRWSYDASLTDDRSQAVQSYLRSHTHDEAFATQTAKLWDLYRFLSSQSFSSPDELRSSVFFDEAYTQPLFTKQEAREVYAHLYSKRGGAPPPAAGDVEVLDALIVRMLYFVRDWSPAFVVNTVDSLSPYIFILKGLEEQEEFGALLGIALDATEAGLKTVASGIQSLSPVVVGLLPIPEAGPIGAVLGWMVASVFIVLLVAIHVSREHFGQAFISSFGLIPIVGQSLYNAAMSGERFLTKTAQKRQRLITSAGKVFGEGVADSLDAMIPDPLSLPTEASAPAPAPASTDGTDALARELASYEPVQGGRKRLSRKRGRTHNKRWQTRRKRYGT
jgi:hypothetical protein